MTPQTKYALSGDVHIAYQVFGQGAIDLIFVRGFTSHLELDWEEQYGAHFLDRLASFARVITLDKRGTGMSDRVPNDALPAIEQRMDDVRAVMDAVGVQQGAVFGESEGGVMCLLFAATFPERTRALVLYGSFARRLWAPDYPWGPNVQEREKWFQEIETGWGQVREEMQADPQLANDLLKQSMSARYERMSASPGAALALAKMNSQIDVRDILQTIHVPTLILHHVDDPDVDIGGARYMVQHIPGAKLIEFPGTIHVLSRVVPGLLSKERDKILDEVEEFLTGAHPAPQTDRILATVLFTDIVSSTEKVAELGDQRWHELLNSHHTLVRKQLALFRGREVDTAGDGFFATFDGPGRAIRCACAICDGVRDLGIEVRAGLHTGECELMGDKVGGIAVHIGARVLSQANPGEVIVSSTVKDLVTGSGIVFEDRGLRPLKGLPGEWRLYAVSR